MSIPNCLNPDFQNVIFSAPPNEGTGMHSLYARQIAKHFEHDLTD